MTTGGSVTTPTATPNITLYVIVGVVSGNGQTFWRKSKTGTTKFDISSVTKIHKGLQRKDI